MASPLHLRPASRQDLAAIAAAAEDAQLFPGEMLPDMIEPYLSGSDTDRWFVATDADRVLGFGFCRQETLTQGTWNLLAIGLLSGARAGGRGSAMLRYLEQGLRDDGQRLLIVETLGTPEFEATRRFYRHNGFVEEARIRDFYEPGGDKIVFWKLL
jgi:ribosomal protein S18 acetylase RimI-like enzyme